MARITVGMPTYNAETHIAESIESILGQSLTDLQLLISDNASEDGTESVCRDYASRDNRINYVRQSKNLGATENYNFVCRQANSEYFKWHSSNDFCTSETVEKCVGVLDDNPGVVLCYPPTKLFQQSYEDATDYDDKLLVDEDSPVARFFHVIDNMALNNVMNGVVRTKSLQSTSLIREFFYADRNMVAELALIGKIVPAEGCNFYRRMDAESATHLKSEKEVLAHFDPSWKRPLSFTNWRIFSAYLSSLMRSRVGIRTNVRALSMLGRRAWWSKSELWQDVTTEIHYMKNDARAYIGGNDQEGN